MLSDHIPDTGQHEALFHGEHANRIRIRVVLVKNPIGAICPML
jgi:hypothetical protein